MDDIRLGRTIRVVRMKRGMRQQDLADRARVSRSTIWRAEHGRIDELTIATLRQVCEPLEIRLELQARGRGTDLDRVVNARHSALHESVARALAASHPEWEQASEVTFNVWGERGVIDLLLWHPGRRALLIIELKSELVDTGDLLATMDRRTRLASETVAHRGWDPLVVATWVVVARSRTTERRIAQHRTVLRMAFPDDVRRLEAWLTDPAEAVRCLSLWRSTDSTLTAPTQRVSRPRR